MEILEFLFKVFLVMMVISLFLNFAEWNTKQKRKNR